MRRLKALVLFLLLAVMAIGFAVGSHGFQNAVNIQTIKIEGFETKGSWQVKFSKFRCRNWNHEDKEKPDESQTWLQWFESDGSDSLLPDGLPKELRGKEEKTVMGVRACFDVRGYNWIVLEPKQPIKSRGITKAIDLWVWGSGYNYDAYLTIRNWQGIYYSFKLGNLEYYGWRNLRVEIPDYVSQYTKYVPRIKPIEIISIKLVANPNEKPDDFYAYFDYMQIQTDIYEERYSGDVLNDAKRWETANK